MPYDDDDDLFNHEFDFVDDDDDDAKPSKGKEEAEPKSPRRRSSSSRDKADKPPARGPKRAKPAASEEKRPARAPRRDAGPAKPPAPPQPLEPAPVGYLMDDPPMDDEPSEIEAEAEAHVPAAPTGPPADHVVHVYEYGEFKRTIARKFTDEEAVSFAEEYTRTGKCYGRYAIATPDDEEPSPTFAAAAKG